MNIKEVEEKTGLPRSNIRFYEKEKLIQPMRNESNGYREYSYENVEDIKKIAYLRTLGISIEDIRRITLHETSLFKVIRDQRQTLKSQMSELENAAAICERMLKSDEIEYKDLKVEEFITALPEYWNKNKGIFKLDSVTFLFMWGGMVTWGIITAACLLIAIMSFYRLPPQIPIQWNDGMASRLVDRAFIFAYPAICIVIRFLLWPIIWRKIQIYAYYNNTVADYLTNFLCFVAMSVEVFTILFVNHIMKEITIVLLADTVVFIGLLIIAWSQLSRKNQETDGRS